MLLKVNYSEVTASEDTRVSALLVRPATICSIAVGFNLLTLHCCHTGTTIKHPVPDRVKPSGLSVGVPGCQKLQMTAKPGLVDWCQMLYSCTHIATAVVKGLNGLSPAQVVLYTIVSTHSFWRQLQAYFSGLLNAPPQPAPQIRRASRWHCAIYKFTYSLTFLLTCPLVLPSVHIVADSRLLF